MQKYPVVNFRRLGQISLVQESQAGYERTISNLEDLSKQLPDASREAVQKQVKECRNWIQDMTDLPEAALPNAEKQVDKCVADLKDLLNKGITDMHSGPQINQEKQADNSTLAYVGVGVVVLGLTIPFLV